MSPRRSSRARSSQQPSAPSQADSSTSSNTTLKDIGNNRATTNGRSVPPTSLPNHRSESIDAEIEAMPPGDQTQPRRSRRGVEVGKDMQIKQPSEDSESNDGVMEDEVTRCICGYVDYPGPSASIREQLDPAAVTEDLGNFFVQCDKCHVWQHGGCLGLTEESMLPDEYYCERCKPEYHKTIKATHLPRSSRYLPVLESLPRPIAPPSNDQGRSKDSKNKILQSTKRRATMNSRGAYDEDELIQRVMEESRNQDATTGGVSNKRGRPDSEDQLLQRPAAKRQRTINSPSPNSLKSESPDPTASIDPETGTTADGPRTSKSGTKLRGAAARNNREKELRERQKQETAAQRQAAADKRNARSERRRVDDSPPPTPSLSPSKAIAAVKSKNEPTSASKTAVIKRLNNGRTNVKGKRLGRNQYTRDRDIDTSDTPARDTSHDRTNGSPTANGEITASSGRSSKAKTHPARTSLNEMKKRVAAILEFVGTMQTQVGDTNGGSGVSSGKSGSNGISSRSSGSNSNKGASTPNGSATTLPTSNLSLVQALTAGLQGMNNEKDRDKKVDFVAQEEFTKLGSKDMMETLTRELVMWQTAYGVYSR